MSSPLQLAAPLNFHSRETRARAAHRACSTPPDNGCPRAATGCATTRATTRRAPRRYGTTPDGQPTILAETIEPTTVKIQDYVMCSGLSWVAARHAVRRHSRQHPAAHASAHPGDAPTVSTADPPPGLHPRHG